ncbi:MAG: ATP-dependent sacrificial sulfur transferase LarE [Candidatus Azotimanducaceae bacterium]
MNEQISEKYLSLKSIINRYDSAVVAFSGGIDSSLVAYVAGEVLGNNALAVTSGSASLKRSDLQLAETLGKDWNLSHEIIVTDELSKPDYRRNPVDRCFHCKTSLYTSLDVICKERGIDVIFNGTNLDDLGDHRPGLMAADNYQVCSPLVEAGFHKSDVRQLANELGLKNADKPQSACLSSRFPYGTSIDEQLLSQVEQAETVLESLGFTQFRVRHHGDLARIEVTEKELEKAMDHRLHINETLGDLGYRYITLDMIGFRSGSLNEGLKKEQIQVVNIHNPEN